MGYSLDNSTNTITKTGSSLAATISATTGTHVLHVKSWGTRGASCVANITIKVMQPTAVPAAPVTNVAVTQPANGATVSPTFSVAANGTLCSSQPIAAMGYSLDNSASTTILSGTSIAGEVSAAAGAHLLHVKSWGNSGASCVSDIAVNVTAPVATPTVSGPVIPSNAVVVNNLQKLTNWQAAFDVATGSGAWSSGITNMVTAPVLSDASRQFITTYSNYGGERYSVHVGTDASSENFVYDAMLYLASPTNDIANIEMDMNQVLSNGQTVIYGFQCDGWSHTWDYTANTGTPTSPNDQWLHSNQTCNPQAWAPNAWHHVQISYSRDSSGNVTYKSVWLDGVEQDLNITVNSAFALGWGTGSLLTNFQVDGMTSTQGNATVYVDKFSIARW